MKTKIQQSILGGIVGTAVMTLIMLIGPMMGMPKMNSGEMLGGMMGMPVFVGWIIHFMIGIIFAMVYAFLFLKVLGKITSNVLKGAIFGFAVFVFAQIVMVLMGALMGGMPPPEGNMVMIIVGSIIGHIIYGIVVALFIPNKK